MAQTPSAPLESHRKSPADVFGHLDDEAWFETLASSLTDRYQLGVRLPGFPADTVQSQFVGSAGKGCLREGFNFFRVVKSHAEKLARPLQRTTRVLDFGCGWGRMLRCFLRDVEPDCLYGADVDPVITAFCHTAFDRVHFSVVPPTPPGGYPDSFFDVVYAYSVFSHLNEDTHLLWIEELMRTLRPGGLFFTTTQSRSFIDFCASLRQKEKQETLWHEHLARSFVDEEEVRQAYDRGEFLHSATGGGDFRPPSFYGETMIPPGYVKRVWTQFGHLVDFRDVPSELPQALIIMQR